MLRRISKTSLMIIVSQFHCPLGADPTMLKLWQFYGFDIILCGEEVVISSSVVFEMFSIPTLEHRTFSLPLLLALASIQAP